MARIRRRGFNRLVCGGASRQLRDSGPRPVCFHALQELSCRVDRALTPFLIVALHPPLYHSNTRHRDEAGTLAIRDGLEPLMLSAGVDAVLAGHVHAFEVTHPLARGAVDACAGIVHVTAGTGCVTVGRVVAQACRCSMGSAPMQRQRGAAL